MNPIVSIIIPIYNVEQYVRQCMESVIGQTIDHSLLECIVVNDCTPDRSMDIVNEVVGKYKSEGGVMSITVLNHEQNRGLSASRNTGMKEATGEFIYFVDSDDYLYPDSLKILLNYHQQEPEADLIMGNHYDELNATKHHKIDNAETIRYKNLLFIGKTKKISAWNSLVRRKLLVDNNIEFIEGIYFEDNVFNYQLIPAIKFAVVAPEITYFYRKNAKGIMLAAPKEKVEKVVNDYRLILTLFLENLNSNCYVGKSIAILDKSMVLTDIVKHNVDRLDHLDSLNKQLKALPKRVVLSHLSHARIFLLILSMLMLPPFNGLTKFRWFRHHYETIVLAFGRCAIYWDKVLSATK
ncbi:MAG: glycosyltransferase family 2 protein [Prevotella sp.]|nr:glycosyltransferase family 2 protein [Prevotella sp.]